MNFFDFVAPIYEILHFGAKKTFKTLNKLEQFRRTDKVLDLGGGTGRISKFFINKVKEIIVLDLSPGMITKCQSYVGLSCLVGSAEEIPFPNDYFDKVIIIDAFHHFKNQKNICKEIHRVLKPKGKALLKEFNPKTILGMFIMKIEKILKMGSSFHSPKNLNMIFMKYFSKIKILNNKTTYYLSAEKL